MVATRPRDRAAAGGGRPSGGVRIRSVSESGARTCMMLPALPAMPRKLIDRSMDRAFRRGGALRRWGERRGKEGRKETLRWRINCSDEGALAGRGGRRRRGGGGDRSGVGSGRMRRRRVGGRLAWQGGDESSRGHGMLLDWLSGMTWRPRFLFLLN